MAAIERGAAFKGLARTAGVAYLVIIVCGLFAEFAVRAGLYVDGDSDKTFDNVLANSGLFRAGVAADLAMLLADVTVAWALYLLLASLDRRLALLATLARIVQAAVIALGVVPVAILIGKFPHGFYDSELRNATVFHETAYLVGLIFFGITCIATGRILMKSGVGPKALGFFLILAGLGYWVDSFGQLLFWDYPEVLTMIVLLPAFIGEFWFCGWLLVRGFGKSDMSDFVPKAATGHV